LGAFVFGIVVLTFLVVEVLAQIEEIRSASEDNVEWNINQLEIETLKLQLAVGDYLAAGSENTDDLKLRFDIYYSRIGIISGGHMADLIVRNGYVENLAKIRAFAEETAVIIDGPTEQLVQFLPDLAGQLPEQRKAARVISLGLLSNMAVKTDSQRAKLGYLLGATAITTVLMFIVLGASLAVIIRLYFQSIARKLEVDFTVARLDATINATKDAVLVLGHDNCILEAGGAFETLFKDRKTKVRGKPLQSILVDRGMKNIVLNQTSETTQAISEKRRTATLKGIGRRQDGTRFPVEYSFQSVIVNQTNCIVMFITDVAEQVQDKSNLVEARNKAQAAAQEKSRFIGIISHEMRTPLNGVLGSLEVIEAEKLSNKQIRFLGVAKRSSTRLLGLVEKVLSVSQLESRKTILKPTTFCVNKFLEKLKDDYQFEAANSKNKMEISTSNTTNLQVFGDTEILGHIVGNLLSNALKFTDQGSIKISANIEESSRQPGALFLVISVKDNGCGISSENLDKIFEDFVSIPGVGGKTISGTGLGLGIAQRLADFAGGWIDVESTLNLGSVFTLHFPVGSRRFTCLDTEEISASSGHEQPENAPLNILVAEDDEISRTIFEEQIRTLGHTPQMVVDGVQCVQSAVKTCFDAILMDFSMPNMDGLEAARRIRASGASKNTPIIGISANRTDDIRTKTRDSGINFLLSKPVSKNALQEALLTISELAGSDGTEPILDKTVIADVLDVLGVEKSRQQARQFIATTDQFFAELDRYDWSDSATEFATSSHKTAGRAALMGARKLAEVLSELEDRAVGNAELPVSEVEIQKAQYLWLITKRLLECEYGLQKPAVHI